MPETNPEDIHQLFEDYFNSSDLESLLGLYTDDAAFVPEPSAQPLTGKDAIRQALQGFLSLKGKMRLTTRYVVRSGDTALLSGEWTLKATGPDGEPIEMGAQTAEVVRLQADGKWLYIADHPFGGQ
jgi:uncharacterized protein (TIGR02246 family)